MWAEVVILAGALVFDDALALIAQWTHQQIGSAAMMSRACAGLAAGRIVIALPGSEAAVRLAMERLIIPELGHLVEQASK